MALKEDRPLPYAPRQDCVATRAMPTVALTTRQRRGRDWRDFQQSQYVRGRSAHRALSRGRVLFEGSIPKGWHSGLGNYPTLLIRDKYVRLRTYPNAQLWVSGYGFVCVIPHWRIMMTRKMRERLAKNQESVRMALSEAIKAGCVTGGEPHRPMRAWRRTAPNTGFIATRCS